MPCRVEKDVTIEQSFEAELVMASFLTRAWYAHLIIMVRLSSPMAGAGVADDECRKSSFPHIPSEQVLRLHCFKPS